MGRLIGSGNSDNFGEKFFINKAVEYLDDTNIIYWNRQIFGREFDVCILMPGKGILVVELKGWREENILRVESNENMLQPMKSLKYMLRGAICRTMTVLVLRKVLMLFSHCDSLRSITNIRSQRKTLN